MPPAPSPRPLDLIARSLYRELASHLDDRQIVGVATALLGEVTRHLSARREGGGPPIRS